MAKNPAKKATPRKKANRMKDLPPKARKASSVKGGSFFDLPAIQLPAVQVPNTFYKRG